MNQINWVEAFNSATTFGVLTAIAFALILLVIRKDRQAASKKQK